MRNLIVKSVILGLVAFSASTFAVEKITITGKPILLERKGELYVYPSGSSLGKDYQYVIIDGKERACFLDKRPDFVNLDVVTINVEVGSEKAAWNCYSLDPSVFVIETVNQ
ncbi:MAG: hypothetical protein AB7I18_01615 [Candidatus Berkiella sp.]